MDPEMGELDRSIGGHHKQPFPLRLHASSEQAARKVRAEHHPPGNSGSKLLSRVDDNRLQILLPLRRFSIG